MSHSRFTVVAFEVLIEIMLIVQWNKIFVIEFLAIDLLIHVLQDTLDTYISVNIILAQS